MMRRRIAMSMLGILAMTTACGGGESDVASTTAAPESDVTTTTTMAPATTDVEPASPKMLALAAEVEDALNYVAGEDYWDPRSLLAPDVVFVAPTGEEVRADMPVPAEFGFDESWDWDRDGTVTFGDYLYAEHEWGTVIATEWTAECEPDGTEIVCRREEQDVFGAAAGLAVARNYQVRVTFADGLVVRWVSEVEEWTDWESWLEQFAGYEGWVADVHPDVYPIVFRGPCCAGDPEGMRFTAESVEAQRSLVPEWAESGVEPIEVSAIQEELMTPGPGREPVDFAIDAPDAEEVTLEMTANYWNANPRHTIELSRVDDERGSHAVTLYLGSDEWLYRFRVDGVWTVDPSNPLRVAAEDGQENSLLVVGETLPWLSEQPGVARGVVEELALPAGVLGEEQTLVVYTPPGYTDEGRYPLLVLLHGYGMPASTWVEAAGVDHAMDNLIAAGEIVPFVVAMPNTERSVYTDAYRDHVLDEVIPYLDANYSLDPGPGSTAIAGQSMGGHGTLQLAYLRPGRFGLAMPIMMAAPWCGVSCVDSRQYANQYPDGFDVDIAMWVGANDDLGLDTNHELFAAYLDEQGLPYDHYINTSDGHYQDGHSVRYVRTILPDVLRRAAQHFTN